MSAAQCRRLAVATALPPLDSQAGAPPDAFGLGQHRIPTTDWERMAQDHLRLVAGTAAQDGRIFRRRIDHILGCFRIWEIPAEAVHGLLGHSTPPCPTRPRLRQIGFDVEQGFRRRLPLDDATLGELFGDRASEVRGAV